MASIYSCLEEVENAGPIFEELIATLEKNSPLWATAANDYGVMKYSIGESFYELVEEAFRVRKAFYKTHHPLLGESYGNMAGQVKSRGELDRAEEFMTLGINEYNNSVGPSHPKLGDIIYSKGLFLCDYRNEWINGVETIKRAVLFVEERFLTKGHFLANLAVQESHMGRIKDAESSIEKAKKAFNIALGEQNSMRARPLIAITYAQHAAGMHAATIITANEGLSAEREKETPFKEREAIFLNYLSDSYMQLGQLGKAMEYSFEALQCFESIQSSTKTITLCMIANIYTRQGNKKSARGYLEQAREVSSEYAGLHEDVIVAAEGMSNFSNDQAIEANLFKVIENAAESSEFVGQSYAQLSSIYTTNGREIEAIFAAKEALRTFKHKNNDYQEALVCLAEALYLIDEKLEAKKLLEEALSSGIERGKARIHCLLAELDSDNAVAHAEKVVELSNGGDNYFLEKLWLIDTYRRAGQIGDARVNMSELKKLVGEDEPIQEVIKKIDDAIDNPEIDIRTEFYFTAREKGKVFQTFSLSVVMFGLASFFTTGDFVKGLILAGVIALHELGHLAAMYYLKAGRPESFFITMASIKPKYGHYSNSSTKELLVEFAGPLSGILALVCLACSLNYINWQTHMVAYISCASYLTYVNLGSLLPVLPVDGGRILRQLFFLRSPKLEFYFCSTALLLTAVISITILGRLYIGYIIVFFVVLFFKRKYFFAEQAVINEVGAKERTSIELIEEIGATTNTTIFGKAGAYQRLSAKPPKTIIRVLFITLYALLLFGTIPLVEYLGINYAITTDSYK